MEEKVTLEGVIDMHVHTNPDLRVRAYNDFELCDAAVRVGARAIVIKSHLGDTVERAIMTKLYMVIIHLRCLVELYSIKILEVSIQRL